MWLLVCGRRRRFVRRPHAQQSALGCVPDGQDLQVPGLARHLALAGRAKRCRLAGHFRCGCHGAAFHRRNRRPDPGGYAHRPESGAGPTVPRARTPCRLGSWCSRRCSLAARRRNYFRAPAIGSALVAGGQGPDDGGRAARQVQQLSGVTCSCSGIKARRAAVRIDRHTLQDTRLCLAIVEAETHAVLIVRGVPDRGRSGGASWRYLVLLASAWSDALAVLTPRPELRSCRAAPRQTAFETHHC